MPIQDSHCFPPPSRPPSPAANSGRSNLRFHRRRPARSRCGTVTTRAPHRRRPLRRPPPSRRPRRPGIRSPRTAVEHLVAAVITVEADRRRADERPQARGGGGDPGQTPGRFDTGPADGTPMRVGEPAGDGLTRQMHDGIDAPSRSAAGLSGPNVFRRWFAGARRTSRITRWPAGGQEGRQRGPGPCRRPR